MKRTPDGAIWGAIGSPISLSRLLQMLEFNAPIFCTFLRDLSRYEMSAFQVRGDGTTKVTEADWQSLSPILGICEDVTTFFDLPVTARRRERILEARNEACSYLQLEHHLTTLRETLEDELGARILLFIPSGHAVHYRAGESLLGDDVVFRFPAQAPDIDEAAKCMGAGRYTATVFHLMRVVEAGVLEFGTAMGVKLTTGAMWQNVLNEVDAKIKAIPATDPARAEWAEISTLLFHVKVAWRNEVMHPKDTYTQEEAESIIGAVRSFMGKLSAAI